jgi:hypothetical protein
MRKNKILFIGLLLSFLVQGQEHPYDYLVFTNSRMSGNYFYSRTEMKAPSYVKNQQQRLPVEEQFVHTPGNSLELQYNNGINGRWTAAVYKPRYRGQDHFKTARFLSFWVYNPSSGTRKQDFPAVTLLLKEDSTKKSIGFGSAVKNKWYQVLIPLDEFGASIKKTPDDITGVLFSQNNQDGKKHKIYIDDIEIVSTASTVAIATKPTGVTAKGYYRHVDISWAPITDTTIKAIKIYRSENGKDFAAVGIQWPSINRYADFTGQQDRSYTYKISFLNNSYQESGASTSVSAKTKTMTDEELMTMIQEACFQYYWDGAEKSSGLARENILGRHNMIASGASGFGIMALVVGTERGFITREQSVARFTRIVNFLERAETFHGVYPHFIDGPTGKVEPFFGRRDNGGDLVETSFLLQGLLTARAYFNGKDPQEQLIRDKITSIWKKVEWDWYRRYPDNKFLFWHWSPDQAWVINHQLIGWNETMVTYLLAIASPSHAVPASMYYTGWANQDSTGQKYRSAWGGTKDGSMYTNGNTYFGIKLDVGVSNGGPLFFTHYSYLGYDPHAITDRYTNYFTNNQNIAKINYRYCQANPGNYKGYGDSCWGLTASDGPFNYSADEPVLRQDKGKIGPTGAISSFPYTPVESMNALKNYYVNYGKFLWGEYGFRDAFNLTENWCSEIYMGLNQAPMTVMIENHRTGLLWKLFMSDKDIQAGMTKLNEESSK